jgi:hypothetical protein
MTKATASYPLCSVCALVEMPVKTVDQFGAKDFDKFAELHELERRFPARARDVRVRHRMRREDVLAVYEVSNDCQCSMQGDHRHRAGLVVRAACGEILFLGEHCGESSVEGFQQAQRLYRDRQDDFVRERLLEEAHLLLKPIGEAARMLTPLFQLRRSLPAEFQEVMRRRASQGARGREVEVQTVVERDGRSGTERRVVYLRGMELWDDVRNLASLNRTRERLVSLIQKKRGGLKTGAAKKLSVELGEIRRELAEHEKLREHAAAFFAHENVGAALQAVHPDRFDRGLDRQRESIVRSFARLEREWRGASAA